MKLAGLVLALGLISVTVGAVDRLQIDLGKDTAYLPYYLEPTTRNADWGILHYQERRPLDVIRPYQEGVAPGTLMVVCPPQKLRDEPSLFEMREYPSWTSDSDPVNLIVNNWDWYHDQAAGLRAIAAAGERRDSIFAVRLFPDESAEAIGKGLPQQQQVFLCTGEDRDGDGEWWAHAMVLLLEDFDRDGLTEAVIHVNGGNDRYPRRMFCVEMETLRIQWELDVACTIGAASVYSCYNDFGPCVMFVGYNPKNGVRDSLFVDYWGYLGVIDSAGGVVSRRIKAYNHGANWLIRAADSGMFYTVFEVPLIPADEWDESEPEGFGIAKVNSLGEPVKIVDCGCRLYELWLGRWPGIDEPVVYARFRDGAIRVYSSELELLAESDPGPTKHCIGSIRIAGREDSLLIFQDGLYEQAGKSLRRILALPVGVSRCLSVAIDSSGAATKLGIAGINWYQIGHIRKRGFWTMATIFYRQNQNYVLMVLSGLLVGLVLVNYYRRRTKSNLDLIARQKDELQRTHEALKEAQEIIIQQERYKQAKDIAGGFAHEIRNSLLPVETAIALLGRIDPSAPEASAKLERYSRNIGSAVSRAVELTHLISEYSHLEAQKQPEPVNLRQTLEDVIESNRIRVEQQGVTIDMDIPVDTVVVSSRSHLGIVFNNLLLNALDALTNRPEPRIIVTSGYESGMVTLRFSDNGCGIAGKDLPRVFDTFFSTKPSSGRGWGLTMARRIMQLYDGEIAVESKESEGTTFNLKFRQPG